MATKFKPSIHFVVGLKLLAAIAGTELLIMLLAGSTSNDGSHPHSSTLSTPLF